jgi:hypothetical protein
LQRELGWRGVAALQLLVGGTVLAALVHPFFLAFLAHDVAAGTFVQSSESAAQSFRVWLTILTLAAGYLGSVALGFVGLRRRGMLASAWVLGTIPVYWLLLSAAAWRAVWQLLVAPHYWDKTEHGLARSSLRAAPSGAPLRRMRPLPAGPSKSGIFRARSPFTDSAANRPPPRQTRAAD